MNREIKVINVLLDELSICMNDCVRHVRRNDIQVDSLLRQVSHAQHLLDNIIALEIGISDIRANEVVSQFEGNVALWASSIREDWERNQK